MNLLEEERPTKRRRTLPETSPDEHVNVYNQLVMALNGSSPETSMLHLSDLHVIVQFVVSPFSL